MCENATRSYRASDRVVGEARRFGEAAVVAWLDPAGWSVADDVGLVISEWVSVAVEQAAGLVHIDVDVHAGGIEITIVDDRAAATDGAEEDLRAAMSARILDALTTDRRTGAADGRWRSWARFAVAPQYTGRVACGHPA